jgi:uncharacterized protein YjiK
MKILSFVIGCLILQGIFVSISCNTLKQKEYASPPGYDFTSAEKILLLSNLEEISGIAFIPDHDSLLMAVNDEEGKMYSININEPKLRREPIKFAKAGDYEDIAFAGAKWQVLQSNGAIHSVELENTLVDDAVSRKILPKGEYEGMASVDDKLVVICKECPDNKETEATIYTINTSNDSLVVEKSQVINFVETGNKKNKKFQASALARHPITGEWFILSHLKCSLAITDEHFNLKKIISLRRSQFTQPEGIAFAPNGDLLISNEGDGASGYILRFNYLN